MNYNLGFIKDEDIYSLVQATVYSYLRVIERIDSLEEFNKNVIDPIKLVFDSKIYRKSFIEILETECNRQIDKGANNSIGYFHQYIFKYAGHGWVVPNNGINGFDVMNEEKQIYAEIKNKHNTMNSSSRSATYLKLLNKMTQSSKNVCYLVEVISKKSQNVSWAVTINNAGRKDHYLNERVRLISIDKFYEIVFRDELAFYKLCTKLPDIINDVITDIKKAKSEFSFLKYFKTDSYNKLLLLAFESYNGFKNLKNE